MFRAQGLIMAAGGSAVGGSRPTDRGPVIRRRKRSKVGPDDQQWRGLIPNAFQEKDGR
jgi:hypothetical protein